jgi:radical SAM protein with 4Fe4S-binding SPASM domain
MTEQSTLKLPEAMVKNLNRKNTIINNVKYHNGVPIPSWIDLNVTELCNRKCVFCPRVDDDIYPNQNLHMSPNLAEKIHNDLIEIGFAGSLILSGYSEPILHPNIAELCKRLSNNNWSLEIVTNGDKLTTELIGQLFDAGVNMIVVSMYDGPEQLDLFTKLFESAGISKEMYILRDRWYDESANYGLKITNRTGNVLNSNVSHELPAPCFYPSYSMMVDWNGDILQCVQDWDKKVKYGNLSSASIFDIWSASKFDKLRRNLIQGKREVSPCNKCDANGCLHGGKHAEIWKTM